VAADNQPEGLSAAPEFSHSGGLLFNAELPTGVNTYRAYQLPWPAHQSQGRH
jgi:hypothetical protein